MRTKIKKFGDEYGLILPLETLQACGFSGEAMVEVADQQLIVSPAGRKVREGWAEAIAAIPQEALLNDFEELTEFRETSEVWDQQWSWPQAPADEKV